VVLVDTSIWLRALRGQTSYAAELDRLLALDAVVGHELVYGELLIGDRGGRADLLRNYEDYEQAPLVSHALVVKFARERRLHGRGVGWIDVHLLASAILGHLLLWTADSELDLMARELDVSYETRRQGL